MKERIVVSSGPVTLVGGGEASIEELSEALRLAPFCVAADGGAELAMRANVPLRALVGDFDSVTAATLSLIPQDQQFRISEQETTDFDKALRCIDAPMVIGVGLTGGRIDHQLAGLHTLARFAHVPCVLLSKNEIVLISPPRIVLPTRPDDIVSIFPLGPVQGQSEGLAWPINGLRFDPLNRIGTSNRATGCVTLKMDRPNAVLILPRRLIQPVVEALMQPDADGWPPRE